MKRATAIISGRVQGLGYRNIVDTEAYKHKITGHVKNLKDRTIEVVAESYESSLKAFFNEININEFPIHVDNISITWDKPTNEYTYFDIIRGDPAEEMGERMDIAIIKLTSMDENQNLMLNKQDLSLEKQDLMLNKQDLSLENQKLMLNKQDLSLEKQDQMINLQTDTNLEIKGLKNNTKSYLNSRFSEIQNELTDIKSALIKAGIKI